MPELSVVISSLNGAAGVDRCLRSLARQTIADSIETVVVDDGSTDATSEVARSHGALLVRHEVNRGLAAARNSGVLAASAPVVAFLDDDCEADASWAEHLLAAYEDENVGVGGPVVPRAGRGLFARYLERHNPLEPLEIELSESEALPYRLKLYLQRQWRPAERSHRRPVHALVGANMSFRRQALLDVGLLDTRFRFGHEELDLCRRVAAAHPGTCFVIEPRAVVVHHFEPSLRDTLRRSRSYGKGSARMFRKWPSSRPTFFPLPVAVAGLVALGLRRPAALAAALLAPQALFPSGVRRSVGERSAEHLLDAYVQLAQEAAGNAGFLHGLWQFRDLEPEEVAA